MGLADILQKAMYSSHVTHSQSLARHQQQHEKVSGIELVACRSAALPETKQESELAAAVSLLATNSKV